MNNNPNIDEVVIGLTKDLNYSAHAEQFKIPILNTLEVKESKNPQIVFLASNSSYLEQLISDGFVQEEDFENRVLSSIEQTKTIMKNTKCENVDQSFLYYQDYDTSFFHFKLYFQDTIMPVGEGKKAARTIIAYFIEPNMHDFYQFSLSVGPFPFPNDKFMPGKIDLENDIVTKQLVELMKMLLDNLSYK